MDLKSSKKAARKLKHCERILLKHENIKFTLHSSNSLFIGNGGLGCGIQREFLTDLFSCYGSLENIVLLPDKPYAFVVYKKVEDAEKALTSVHGQKLKSGHMFYISYVNKADVPQYDVICSSWPEGLILLKDFLTPEEERELLSIFNFEECNDKAILKHRKVKHYGYEFIYGSNNIDKNKCLDSKIPGICIPHLKKLVALGYIPRIPEQLTVNHYLPGQGIPPHVDTHSAFEDGIISLSLGSQVVMDFYSPEHEVVPVLLPRRSALIMLGESRYKWKHGITPRKTDVVPIDASDSSLTLCHRSPRTSLTFRLIRTGKCNCDYKEQCDSQVSSSLSTHELVNEVEAKELENKYVNQVYEEIAEHFNVTRYKPWPKVASFLSSIPSGSLILDVGCGNGKNMKLSSQCYEIGCDASCNLAQLCSQRNTQVVIADCLKLPFRDNCADVIICIAVIHHMSTKVRRTKAVQEIVRVLRPSGRALIYVWAFEQESPEGPSNYLKQNKLNHQHNLEMDEHIVKIESSEIQLNDSSPKILKMPIHRNRTNFVQQDMLVPWKEKKGPSEITHTDTENVHHRYYHVFAKGELESMVIESGSNIISSYYDKGNWCVLLEK